MGPPVMGGGGSSASVNLAGHYATSGCDWLGGSVLRFGEEVR